jgi:hypothetical protein
MKKEEKPFFGGYKVQEEKGHQPLHEGYEPFKKGYEPTKGLLDISNPPQGGSGVPPKVSSNQSSTSDSSGTAQPDTLKK